MPVHAHSIGGERVERAAGPSKQPAGKAPAKKPASKPMN